MAAWRGHIWFSDFNKAIDARDADREHQTFKNWFCDTCRSASQLTAPLVLDGFQDVTSDERGGRDHGLSAVRRWRA